MDRIKSLSNQVLELHKSKFGEDFGANKTALDEVTVIRSKGLKNEIAGYITKLIKRQIRDEKEREARARKAEEAAQREKERAAADLTDKKIMPDTNIILQMIGYDGQHDPEGVPAKLARIIDSHLDQLVIPSDVRYEVHGKLAGYVQQDGMPGREELEERANRYINPESLERGELTPNSEAKDDVRSFHKLLQTSESHLKDRLDLIIRKFKIIEESCGDEIDRAKLDEMGMRKYVTSLDPEIQQRWAEKILEEAGIVDLEIFAKAVMLARGEKVVLVSNDHDMEIIKMMMADKRYLGDKTLYNDLNILRADMLVKHAKQPES